MRKSTVHNDPVSTDQEHRSAGAVPITVRY